MPNKLDPITKQLEEKLAEILPSDKNCSVSDGCGGWTETDHFSTDPNVTWIVCNKRGGKSDEETFNDVKRLIYQEKLDLLKTIESECACPFCDNTGKVWNNKKEKMVECGDSCIYLKLQLLRDKLKKGE